LTGAVHFGNDGMFDGTSQQSCPAVQHSLPQQNVLAPHAPPSQGGVVQWPLSQ